MTNSVVLFMFYSMSFLLLMLRVPTATAERVSALKDLFARDYGLRNFAYDATRLRITLFNLGEDASPGRVALVDCIAHGTSSSGDGSLRRLSRREAPYHLIQWDV